MVETAGSKLRRARQQSRQSLEDAARVTKIRAAQLADLEDDEYSNFANLAYAKGFLVSYARFLGVDVREDLGAFADASTFGLDDYQYLSAMPVGEYRAPTRPWKRKRRQGRVLAITGLTLATSVAVCVSYLYISYQRLGDLDKLAERQAAREHGGSVPPAHSATVDRTNSPSVLPVSATPLPTTAPATTVPIAPPADYNRIPGAAIASDDLATQPLLTLTRVDLADPKSPATSNAAPVAAAVPAAAPSPADHALFVHSRNKTADSFHAGPKPQKVANSSLE